MNAVRAYLEEVDRKTILAQQSQLAPMETQAVNKMGMMNDSNLKALTINQPPFGGSRPSTGNSRPASPHGSRREAERQTSQALDHIIRHREANERHGDEVQNLRARSTGNVVFDTTSSVGSAAASPSSRKKVSAAIAGPRFANQMQSLREFVRHEVDHIKGTLSAAHGYIIFSDTINERFFYFQDVPHNSSSHHMKNGPANCIVWSSSSKQTLGGGGIASMALHSTQPVLIEDATCDGRYDLHNEPYLSATLTSNTTVRTILAIPIFPETLSSLASTSSNQSSYQKPQGSGGKGVSFSAENDGVHEPKYGTHDIVGILVLVNKTNGQRTFNVKDERMAIASIHKDSAHLEELFCSVHEADLMKEW
eukprot:CAMPEP_0114330512 /NCGR_PEP_ID=MMETSP0101-20121206/1804_1 /TAXON_ID=38822 ORGANISM="Pteridomonas danica, Strain PT" /NCGR_SAMPLE_ID=MMETSP0101 /ASSEMBLY_ACC=CAM_ASM_000211 /LENGTH=364 /DNA_ID=CAMNT_0001460555 /DNA_START=150 /DNA_END=1241 /DNA_ORIENTATION=+